jgi:hypothetical protein
MKTFEQLNDQELLALTDDQIEYYIKLKKAETGIKIISFPETPVYAEIPQPELEMYVVAGRVFNEKEKAEEIASVINKHLGSSFTKEYDYYRSGGNHKYAKPFDGSLETINIVRLYSMSTYNSIKDTIQSNKKIEDAYKEIKNAYDKEDEKASEIVEMIHSAIAKARECVQLFQNYKVRIVEYLQLANGNRDVAWNFFEKAYVVEPAVKNMILESPEYVNAVNSYIKA